MDCPHESIEIMAILRRDGEPDLLALRCLNCGAWNTALRSSIQEAGERMERGEKTGITGYVLDPETGCGRPLRPSDLH